MLVNGESGSGKELTAQAIHRHSSRAEGPFVPVNCGAIQATLIQSELFGHEKGAFTGANKEGRGLIEAANGGTIFLDEIGDLSLDLQINLLRFLQEKTINRVGSTRSIRVDARVIAATHVDLEKAVAAGTFREDLFYRLNVVPLRVPSLRERHDDIGVLAEHFFQQFAAEKGPQLKGFSRRAMVAMGEHVWPGNVRELINRVRRAMVMTEGRLIGPTDLGLEEREDGRAWDALEEARTRAERGAISVSLAAGRPQRHRGRPPARRLAHDALPPDGQARHRARPARLIRQARRARPAGRHFPRSDAKGNACASPRRACVTDPSTRRIATVASRLRRFWRRHERPRRARVAAV